MEAWLEGSRPSFLERVPRCGGFSVWGMMKLGAFLALATPFFFRSGLCTLYVCTYIWDSPPAVGNKAGEFGEDGTGTCMYNTFGTALSLSNGIV